MAKSKWPLSPVRIALMAADPTISSKLPHGRAPGLSLPWAIGWTVAKEPIVHDWAFGDVNKEEILNDYRQSPDAFIPEFVSLDDLVEIYLRHPGFHSSFQDFMAEWQEEDNVVECEF
jgi:hypothetical protein